MLNSQQNFFRFFIAESLSKNESNVTQEEKKPAQKNIITTTKHLMLATLQSLLNPALTVPFFWGPIYSQLPHVRSSNPIGHIHFPTEMTDAFTTAAKKTQNGIVTFWAGPFPVLYVASNEARHALVRESHVGIVDNTSWEYINWLSGGNNIMSTFPGFRPIDSETYQMQRRFLMQRFHGGAKHLLAEIDKTTTNFLQYYYEQQGERIHTLKELVTALVIHTSSHLLGLTQVTLDKIYLKQPEFTRAIDQAAAYGISLTGDPAFEKEVYDFFLEVLKLNFDQILSESPDANLIRNIFASMNVVFPQNFADFNELPKDIRHKIAMNFAATGLGGMMHSTISTLDWSIARLLKEQNKLNELTALMAKYKKLDLKQEKIFDKDGPLFPLCEWVLHNVFLYPPFSHEFFLNRKSLTATLPDKSTITVHSGSLIFVNYIACNRSNEHMASPQTFSQSLKEEATIGKFITDQNVASFGGSLNNKENRHSRICPGAKTSLYEQMLMIAILLRDYSLKLVDAEKLSCEIDTSKHPLCVRSNLGEVILKKRVSQLTHSYNFFNMEKPAPLISETKNMNINKHTGTRFV